MVQRKVVNKLGIQANYTLKGEKRQAIMRPLLQNLDAKSKGADLKTIKMKKKSRSIKLSDVEFRLHSSSVKTHDEEVVEQPGKPPTLANKGQTLCVKRSPPTVITPSKTPSPKKPSPSNNKSPYASPNYMKSTSSSEARKEKTPKVSISASTPKIHRARHTLGKTSTSLSKIRTLIKTPSFKHTRPGANKKMVVCEEDVEVQRATCSSTLKDSKFPPYLELKPGATEAQGTTVTKVCPYTYCSLNGHHHSPAPPLKYFLSSRRKLLKTQKNFKPEVILPGKKSPSEIKVKRDGSEVADVFSGMSEMPEIQKEDFFVEIYVPENGGAGADNPAQVSESLSEEACSENHQSDDDRELSDINFSSDGALNGDSPVATLESSKVESDLEVDAVSAVSLDQLFDESSDMEWEEAQIPAIRDEEADILVHSDCGKVEDEPGFADFEFLAWKLLPYVHDEIMECLQFSDADSSSDSEFNQTDDDRNEEPVSDDETLCTVEQEEESIEEPDNCFLNPTEEVTEARIEGLDSVEEPNDSNGDCSNEHSYVGEEITQGSNFDILMEGGESSECSIEAVSAETEDIECVGAQECEAEDDERDAGEQECQQNGEEYPTRVEEDSNGMAEAEQTYVAASTAALSELEGDSDEVNLRSNEDDIAEAKVSDIEEINQTEGDEASINIRNRSQEIQRCIPQRMNDSSDELQNCCDKMKRSMRRGKADKESEKDRDFNPRPPNFLPVEPEPDAEKVDLRHQEMDERRNSEDWMLDHALQKTINQLAPARKRKVSLLVKAFESVLPTPNYEPQIRRNSSPFALARTIQAYS